MNGRYLIPLILVAIMFVPQGITGTAHAEPAPNAAADYPNGWTHRPIVEHFTGLSCSPCMNGAHPDASRLYEEEALSKGYPWNYVEFHELNGEGKDDLMTDESRDRMRFYQPGVSGTPDLEMDGGYVECGGSHGSTADANYEDMKKAIKDSGERDAIKKINIQVGALFDGKSFTINVTVDYLRNDEQWVPSPDKPLPDDTLHGSLYVFMVEDNVSAYSTIKKDNVLCHNVFRGYAIKDYRFDMQVGDSMNKMGVWDVPTTQVRDGNEEPIRVPINPLNVYPVAVVYDLDDRSSGRGDGSENNDGDGGNGSPRALNSATPMSTAYDSGNEPPNITVEKPTSKDGKIQINALIQDDSGELAAAYVLYREAGRNDSGWYYKALTIEGEECSGDTCTIGSGEAFAVLNFTDDMDVEYSIMAYDGNWTRGITPIEMYEKSSSNSESALLLVGGVAGILGALGAGIYVLHTRKPGKDEAE